MGCYKKIVLAVILLAAIPCVYADMYSNTGNSQNNLSASLTSKTQNDQPYYANLKAGGSFQPTGSNTLTVLKFGTTGGLSCNDYDFAANFASDLNQQTVTNWVKNAGLELVKALPWIILAETEPSWYTHVKQAMNMAQQTMQLNYQKCQDIVSAAGTSGGWEGVGSDLQSWGKQFQVKNGDKTNQAAAVSAPATCEKLKNPATGQEIGSGKLYLKKNTLQYAGITADDDLALAKTFVGEAIFDGTNCAAESSEKGTATIQGFYTDTLTAMAPAATAVIENNDNSDTNVKILNVPGNPLLKSEILAIQGYTQPRRQMETAIFVDQLAHAKTIRVINSIIDGLEKGCSEVVYPAVLVKLLQEDVDKLIRERNDFENNWETNQKVNKDRAENIDRAGSTPSEDNNEAKSEQDVNQTQPLNFQGLVRQPSQGVSNAPSANNVYGGVQTQAMNAINTGVVGILAVFALFKIWAATRFGRVEDLISAGIVLAVLGVMQSFVHGIVPNLTL